MADSSNERIVKRRTKSDPTGPGCNLRSFGSELPMSDTLYYIPVMARLSDASSKDSGLPVEANRRSDDDDDDDDDINGAKSDARVKRSNSRRQSFLYWQESWVMVPDDKPNEALLTPFAQLLLKLQNIRTNFIKITGALPDQNFPADDLTNSSSRLQNINVRKKCRKKSEFETIYEDVTRETAGEKSVEINSQEETEELADYETEGWKLESHEDRILAFEMIKDFDWIVNQLQGIQTQRPIYAMAKTKFKSILSRELSKYSDSSEMSDFINQTFIEDEPDTDFEFAVDSDDGHDETGLGQSPRQRFDSWSSRRQGTEIDDDKIRCVMREIGANTIKDFLSQDHNNFKDFSGQEANRSKEILLGDARHTEAAASTAAAASAAATEAETDENEENEKSTELIKMLTEDLNLWTFDVFRFNEVANRWPLTALAYAIFTERQLLRSVLKIDEFTFLRFFVRLETTYHPRNPYHNNVHAADVLQTTNILLNSGRLADVFPETEICTALLAAAVHDVDHPGVTNQYLINTGHELAMLYNDVSVLENHHLATTFKIMSDPQLDIFQNIPHKVKQSMRKLSIDMVLATDMSKHMDLIADLKTMVETKKISSSSESMRTENFSFNDRVRVLKNMLHCADLSNPTKPQHIYENWAKRITDEFYHQGDLERAKGIELSPLCDRFTANFENSQLGFIDFVVHPLWEIWNELVYPEGKHVLEQLAFNRRYFESRKQQDSRSIRRAASDPVTCATQIEGNRDDDDDDDDDDEPTVTFEAETQCPKRRSGVSGRPCLVDDSALGAAAGSAEGAAGGAASSAAPMNHPEMIPAKSKKKPEVVDDGETRLETLAAKVSIG